MESQILNQWLSENWSDISGGFQSTTMSSEMWPDYMGSTEYDPLSLKSFQILSDPAAACDQLMTSSPSPWDLPSSISDASSRNSSIDPLSLWSVNNVENSPIMTVLDLASSPESSEASSPGDSERDSKIKKSIKRGRKRASKESPEASPTTPKNGRITSHNLIEKRYRNNLNSKIISLRDSIPSLCLNERAESLDSDSGETKRPLRFNKGVILDSAIKYIAQLEKQQVRQAKENARLRVIIDGSVSQYFQTNQLR